jgi:PAS domain S-box-containing protein
MPTTHLHILAEAAPLLASLDLDEALRALERLVVPEIADWCAIHLVDENGNVDRIDVAHRDPERVAFALEFQKRYPPDPERSAVSTVLRTGKGMLVADVSDAMIRAAAQDEEHRRALQSLGVQSVITVPLKARGRSRGAMTLITERGGRVYDVGWLSLAESVAALAALAVDNTRLYTDLERSRHHFETILDGVPEGITVQSDDGRLVYANQAAARSMGFPDSTTLMSTPIAEILRRFEVLDEAGRPLPIERLPGRRALAGEEAPSELMCYHLRATGEARWVRVLASRLPPGRDGHALAVNVMQDVTERIEYEQRLEQARAEAEQASAAKTQFLAVVSHELRTPLNAISGFTELLRMQVPGQLNDSQRDYLSRIESSARHLTGLIEQILTFSRIETGREDLDLEVIDAGTVVREVFDLLESLAQRKGLTLERSTSDDPVLVRVDVPRTRQILLNLVGNAIKFTDAGSIRLETELDGSHGIVHVVDTGLGIPAAEVERIFEPFTQVDSSATRRIGGTGLGLAVSRQLARLMGGDIAVESTPGVGSRFSLRVPAADA